MKTTLTEYLGDLKTERTEAWVAGQYDLVKELNAKIARVQEVQKKAIRRQVTRAVRIDIAAGRLVA